jgi:hypothetical protein
MSGGHNNLRGLLRASPTTDFLLTMQAAPAEMARGRHGRNPALLLAKMQFGSRLPGGHVGLYCCGRPKGNRRAGLVGRAVMIAVWDPRLPITPFPDRVSVRKHDEILTPQA